MNTIRETGAIVAAVDGSAEALAAARFAVDSARSRRCKVILAHAVVLPQLYPFTVSGMTFLRERGQQLLDDVLAQVEPGSGVQIETILGQGSIVEFLARVSADARFVVVGREGTPWVGRLFTGSVSSSLSNKAECPVVSIPHGWEPDDIPGRPVVVALDGETEARAAIRFAFEAADLTGRLLVAVHAVPDQSPQVEVAASRANLVAVLAGWREEFPRVHHRTESIAGDVEDVIFEAASSASLIVVGRPHSATRLPMWSWSVGSAVLKRARCPLAVIPQDSGDRDESTVLDGPDDLLPGH